MSAVLNEAETKFFSSRGQEVDTSLSPEPTAEPTSQPVETPAVATPPAPVVKAPETPAPQATEPAKTPEKHVPIEALHAERRQRQQIEQQFQTLQQQWKDLQEAITQAGQPQEQRPDPEQDPYGALEYDNRQLRQQIEQIDQWRGKQQQTEQQRTQIARLTQHLTSSEQQFATTQKDYFQAADFAIKREDLRLQAFYPDPQQRQNILRQEIANVVAQAIQAGASPAQIIYQHAKNLGYTGPAPAATSGTGGIPAPAAPAVPAPPVSEVVQKIEKGLKQQSNLSAGGSTPPSEMTPEMLAGISDPDEFNKQWNKAFKRR